MRYLFLLPLLIVVSCASVQSNQYYGFPPNTLTTTLDRASACKLENIGGYYGDCWIDESIDDPYFMQWVGVLDMGSSWKMLKELNQKLMVGMAIEETSVETANRMFDTALVQIDEITNLKINTRVANVDAQVARRNQNLAIALGSISQSINQASQPSYGNNNKFKNVTYYFESEIDGGSNTICVYSGLGGKITRTIGTLDICPLTVTE